ncbi:unnamed protein product [[Candida] boidinii]|uniref:Unnamed protein product n=1 Tax=Candida boidinii TaxID=5477 RepID=A0A9W6T298_CANBO|nr:oxidoreductase activity protein [[Candida] boidinii]GME72116.1 unnamed protein product [[Candida] boidinii]GMF99009.1 unnamed protein product [[Candida] boidinii]
MSNTGKQIPDQFTAIGVHDHSKWLEPKTFKYTPHPARVYDIDVKIECCAVCGGDVFGASGAWGSFYLPVAFGHEIVGEVVRVGGAVNRIKVGDRIGIGAQCDSCGTCMRCNNHKEVNCRSAVHTYFGTYKDSDVNTQGGYSDFIRVNEKFAFKIPEKLESKYAAPLLCGGITGFKPLMSAGVTKGTKVGVLGIGGIGHMTILFAKAMGAEVYAISRNHYKEALCKRLGADHYIATSDEGFEHQFSDTLDLIISTGNTLEGETVNKLLLTLVAGGQIITISAPPPSGKLDINPSLLLANNVGISGSVTGSPRDIEYMLDFAVEHNIRPWVEEIPISEANVSNSWQRMQSGDVTFRLVLTDYDKEFNT